MDSAYDQRAFLRFEDGDGRNLSQLGGEEESDVSVKLTLQVYKACQMATLLSESLISMSLESQECV